MSAFVCNPKTVGTIAQAVVTHFAPFEIDGKAATPESFAEGMAMVNLESVGYRYRMTLEQTAQDFMAQSVSEYLQECGEAVSNPKDVPVNRLLGAVSCWLYQSCESDACVESEVYQTVKKYEDILEHRCQQAGLQCEGWELR